jgi:hypothetical protein
VVTDLDPSSELTPSVVVGGMDTAGSDATDDVVNRAVPAAIVALTAD